MRFGRGWDVIVEEGELLILNKDVPSEHIMTRQVQG